MTDNTANNKRIAKNTLVLYVRMLFMMAVLLYTSRVVLSALGVDDFGIYNVVGGVVAMFSMISGSLSAAISRFLTFELGKGDKDKLATVFSSSVTIQIAIFAIILVCAETIGVWFLNNKMVIPESRMVAANWVFQFSVILFGVNLISVPYNAAITAHERMTAFAYISIVDALGKLGIAYAVSVSPIDRLIMYGALLLILGCVMRLIYGVYCNRHFEECHYRFVWDKELLKQMFSFAGWNFIGSSSSVLRSQGVNIILNLFFGPSVNAARAISVQVNQAVNGFVSNFMTALTPQITKAYARGDYEYLLQCIYKGSKFSYFLLFFLSLPILVDTEYILKLWLKVVPDTAVWFVRYILLFSLADTYSRTLINANNATGDIKKYQLVIGSLNLTVLPLVCVILVLGCAPEDSVLVSIVVALIGIFPRLYFNKKHFPITYIGFIKNVITPTLIVSVFGFIVSYIMYIYIETNIYSFIAKTIIGFIITAMVIFTMGCTREEKQYIVNFVNNKLKR